MQRYLDGDAVEACPPTLGYRLRKAYRRNRGAVLVGGTIAAVFLVATGVSSWQAVRALRAEQSATESAETARSAEAEAIRERDSITQASEKLAISIDLQQQTRYAAEMNLVQAAYNAKEMDRVKRVLLANPQARRTRSPRPGMVLLGPQAQPVHEGIYAADLRPGISGSPSMQGHTAFSDDARFLAHVPGVSNAPNTSKLTAQLWDVETGQRIKEIELDLDAILQFKDGRRVSAIMQTAIRFMNHGRDVLIGIRFRTQDPNQSRLPGSGASMFADVLWKAESMTTEVIVAPHRPAAVRQTPRCQTTPMT